MTIDDPEPADARLAAELVRIHGEPVEAGHGLGHDVHGRPGPAIGTVQLIRRAASPTTRGPDAISIGARHPDYRTSPFERVGADGGR